MDYFEQSDVYEAFIEYRKTKCGMSGAYVYYDEASRSKYLNDVFDTLIFEILSKV